MDIDLLNEPIGEGDDGPVYLHDIWPTSAEIDETIARSVDGAMFKDAYADVFTGDERWRALDTPSGDLFAWDPDSTYVRLPPYFDGMPREPRSGRGHRRGAGARHARRLGHDRPHLAGRRDPPRLARRQVPDRARRRAARVQLVRRAARQPRGDGARHVRERPAAQPARRRAARERGRCICRTARRARSSTSRAGTARRACRRSCSRARSTAQAPRATGRRRGRSCSASAR